MDSWSQRDQAAVASHRSGYDFASMLWNVLHARDSSDGGVSSTRAVVIC
jgi:hypothetical protein